VFKRLLGRRAWLSSAIALLLAFSLGLAVSPVAAPLVRPADPAPATFSWTFQTYGTAAMPTFALYQQWAADIYQVSQGRLKITIHPVGTVVPLMESLGAVTRGTLDGAIMWGPFWRGIDATLALSCGQTSGLNEREFTAWLHNYGGLALIQEAYARHNIHWLPAIPLPAETFLWAHRPIRNAADLRGLRVRAAGFSLDVFAALGAAAVFMPGGETPPALMKRTIDAGEFATLVEDVTIGFHEAARYAMVGARAPVQYHDALINADRWKALPADLQSLVASKLLRYGLTGHTHVMRLDQEAMQTAQQRGTVFVKVSEELVQGFRSTLDRILNEQAAREPNFAKVWQSLRSFRDSFQRFQTTLYPWK
jgi:TRAP-type mannitol/chloroaromatic compound transport system substrate-binding protein